MESNKMPTWIAKVAATDDAPVTVTVAEIDAIRARVRNLNRVRGTDAYGGPTIGYSDREVLLGLVDLLAEAARKYLCQQKLVSGRHWCDGGCDMDFHDEGHADHGCTDCVPAARLAALLGNDKGGDNAER